MVCQEFTLRGTQSTVMKESGKAEEAGPRSLSPAAHRRRLQLHETFFWFPLGGHQTTPGEEQGEGSVSNPLIRLTGSSSPPRPGSAPAPARPSHRRSTRSSASSCQSPGGTAQPLGLGLRAVRGSPWGHASAGAASGTGNAAKSSGALEEERAAALAPRNRGRSAQAGDPRLGCPGLPLPRLPHGHGSSPHPHPPPPRPGHAAPEHAPGRNLHGGRLGLGIHRVGLAERCAHRPAPAPRPAHLRESARP